MDSMILPALAPTILVVDDDPDLRASVGILLELAGYAVVTAGDGAAALDYLRSHPLPALVVLDLMMPQVDGWEVLTRLRSDASLSDIPVVVCSAASRTTVGGRLPGGVPVVSKPFDPDALLAAIAWRVPPAGAA